MKNYKKILPAIALAGAGVVALAGAGDASAYNYQQRIGVHDGVEVERGYNPNDVKVCYTLNNIMVPTQTTFTIPLEADNGLDLTSVRPNSAGSDTGVTYAHSSSTAAEIEIPFDEDGSQSSVKKCISLNFGSALASDSAFDTYTVIFDTPTSSNTNVPVDTTSGKGITFGYQLSIDQTTKEPTVSSGTYQAEYWTKSISEFSSSMPTLYGHVELTKKVRGNAANPDGSFTFKVNATKSYSGGASTYHVRVGSSSTTCTYGSDCEFTMKHGETANIGCAASNCANDGGEFIRNGVTYTITETNALGHTPYVDGGTASTNTVSGSVNAALKTHNFVNEKTNTIAGRFLNILPFIILAILATVGVVTLRKASKKNEA